MDQADTLTWPFTPTGDYIVKSGYTFLQQEYHSSQPGQLDPEYLKPLWKLIWSLQVPSKVKNFIWRAAKNSLPTKTNLVKRKVIDDDLCEHCKDQKEDVIHALYHCSKLLDLWFSVKLWNHSCLKQATSFIDLIGCVFAENRDPTLFSMVAWAIWYRRNNIRIGKPAAPLNELLTQAQDRLREFKLYNSSTITPAGRPPTSWQAPDSNTYKVNFDGALFAVDNSAGLGVVIRNSEGQVMLSLSEKTTLPFIAIEVEAMAARRALKLALETGFQQITLEGDSQTLILALKNNTHFVSSYGHILKDI